MKKILNKLTIMLLAAVMLVSSLPVSAANVADFKDVSKDHWFYDAVSYALTHEMTTGTSETEFSPFKTMTRAEFITMLGRLNGNKDSETNNHNDYPYDYLYHPNSTDYTDVGGNWWYNPHINWADHFGIVDTTGTQFRPHDAITREEMAIFLGKYIEVLGVNLPADPNAPDSFTDAAAISAAAPYVSLVRECGLIVGDTEGTFRPNSTLTRAEAFTIDMRVREVLQSEISGLELPRFVTCYTFYIAEFPDGVKVGESVQMSITRFIPYDCTETEGIIWYIPEGSEHIATITEDGALTAHSEGRVLVYAQHPVGGPTSVCTLSVRVVA